MLYADSIPVRALGKGVWKELPFYNSIVKLFFDSKNL